MPLIRIYLKLVLLRWWVEHLYLSVHAVTRWTRKCRTEWRWRCFVYKHRRVKVSKPQDSLPGTKVTSRVHREPGHLMIIYSDRTASKNLLFCSIVCLAIWPPYLTKGRVFKIHRKITYVEMAECWFQNFERCNGSSHGNVKSRSRGLRNLIM